MLSPCCQQEMTTSPSDRADLTINLCPCGKRHFRLKVDPIRMGLTLKPLGT